MPERNTPKLTIIVPVYNEIGTVEAIINRLQTTPLSYPEQQVIVVDDGSTDGTREKLSQLVNAYPGLLILFHEKNKGKGAAIRTGLQHATGTVTAIQDADLEYDPAQLAKLATPIWQGEADAVFGSRYLKPENYLPWTKFRLAVHLMNGIVRLLYGTKLTDVNTCYKLVKTDLYPQMNLQCERFEYCAEVTAKLCRLGILILELPISYTPRSKAEGKKIGWRDARQFIGSLVYWRFRRFQTKENSSTVAASAAREPKLAILSLD